MHSITKTSLSFLALALLSSTSAKPTPEDCRRAVDELNQEAFEEAQQRDDTATRAFSNVAIKTDDGRCLSVDLLSGDFRANLNPIDILPCDGSSEGQLWDVITSGKHNDRDSGFALLVNTLTQACVSFDPRREVGDQVHMFSCGGRADGGGETSNSQLFAFDGDAGPVALQPDNAGGRLCLAGEGVRVDIKECDEGDDVLFFTFGEGRSDEEEEDFEDGQGEDEQDEQEEDEQQEEEEEQNQDEDVVEDEDDQEEDQDDDQDEEQQQDEVTTTAPPPEITVPPTTGNNNGNNGNNDNDNDDDEDESDNAVIPIEDDILTVNPTTPVPVSRAGDFLNPTAAAEAHQVHKDDTRFLESVSIVAPNGQCLFVDPTAGDFRQNLIPVQLVDCSGSPNEKWDLITEGVHNDEPGTTLLVSSLTGGCVSFDGRRQENDRVTIFSCGGRAAGEGGTDFAQIFPFDGEEEFSLPPRGENGNICLVPVGDKIDGTACTNDGSQNFRIVVLNADLP